METCRIHPFCVYNKKNKIKQDETKIFIKCDCKFTKQKKCKCTKSNENRWQNVQKNKVDEWKWILNNRIKSRTISFWCQQMHFRVYICFGCISHKNKSKWKIIAQTKYPLESFLLSIFVPLPNVTSGDRDLVDRYQSLLLFRSDTRSASLSSYTSTHRAMRMCLVFSDSHKTYDWRRNCNFV